MGCVCTKTVKEAAWVIIEKCSACTWATTSTPTRRCVRQLPSFPAGSSAQGRELCHMSDEAGSERPCESYLHRAAGRGERRGNSVLKVSARGQRITEVGHDTKEMLKSLNFAVQLHVTQPTVKMYFKTLCGII